MTSREKSGFSKLRTALLDRDRARRRDRVALVQATATSAPRRNDLSPRLQLVDRSPESLQAPARNVREVKPGHLRQVANTIAALGFSIPVVIDANGAIIDGVVRVEAAKLLGLETVPCIVAEHLTAQERRLLRLAANKLTENGSWSLPALKAEFEELIVDLAPLEITGFDLPEIDQIVMDVEETSTLEQGNLEPLPNAVAVARLGDVFQLGPHCLICGDSTDPAVVKRLMLDMAEVRIVLTDEPYNVKIRGHVTSGPHREFAMASGEMTACQFQAFNVDWMTATLPYLCVGGVLGTFIDWPRSPIVHAAAISLTLTPINLVVWSKTNAGMGSLYRSQHELLPLFRKGDEPIVNNVQLGRKGRWRSNVWVYPGASSLGSDARKGLKDHPTVKPTAMLVDALLDMTNRGDVVLDPFLGSGSTLIAAEKCGRVCCGIELDPLYVDVICRRYKAVAGKSAVHGETGMAFEALATERANDASNAAPVPDSHDARVK